VVEQLHCALYHIRIVSSNTTLNDDTYELKDVKSIIHHNDLEFNKPSEAKNILNKPGEKINSSIKTYIFDDKIIQFSQTALRFFPDVLTVICAILFCPIGGLDQHPNNMTLYYYGVPIVIITFLVVSFLQQGTSRLNLSRWGLESRGIRFLGYISYPVYLLQRPVVEFYGPYVYHSIKNKKYEISYLYGEAGGNGYDSLPLHQRFLWTLVLFGFCFLIQKYFQDTFIIYLYTKFREYKSAKKSNCSSSNVKVNVISSNE